MQLPKALSTVSKLIFFNVLLFSFSASAQNLNNLSRKEYSDYLNNHPFMQRQRMTPEDIKKLPKKDRPDLAWELDYLTTMDPTTGKPERERLFPTLDMIDQMQATLTPAVPGSSPAASWVERGPNNVGGRTRAIMWDPNDPTGKKVWAGGVTGGLWYNNDITNANSQWQSINDFWDNIAVTCIAYDPNNPDTMYVGTGEGYGSTSTSRGAGIWRSTNGGSNWTRLSSTTNFYYVNDIVVRNENGNSVVYAAVDGNFYNGTWHGAASAGLQRSTNHGSSWTQVLPSIPSNSPNYVASDLEIGPNNRLWVGTTATPYAANDRGGGRVLYSDNGTTWNTAYSHSVTNGYGRVEVAVAPSNASYVYAIIEDQNKVDGIVRTTNGGSTWSALSEPNDDDLGIPSTDFSRGQAWYDLIAAVNPTNPNTIIVGAINLHMSTNGGTSWNQISKWSNNPNMGTQSYSFVHADQHNILFKPGSSSEVIFGTDGGVFWTNNISSAATSSVISARNNGYNVTQFYAGAINPIAGSNIMVAGSQDNGSHRFSNAGINATTEISGGDGAYCFIDQTNGLDVVTSYVYNNYYYFNNSGSNYVRKILSNSNTGMFINPADLDDNNNILYSSARNGQIYKISNYNLSSYSLDSINITGLTAMPTAIKVSPYNNSANVYVGDMSGNLVKINNANGSSPTFTNLTPPTFPNATISSIEFGSSESEIIVTFKNYGVNSIFYSFNGGAGWSIDNKEGNLPDMPIRWAIMNPNNNNEVIAATEVGVWATTNFQSSSPTWAPSNSGLANVRVDMLQYRSSDNTVMAITHGRGVFTSNAWNQSTPNPTSNKYRTLANITTIDANGVADSNGVTCETAGLVASPNFSVNGAAGPDVTFTVINSNNSAGVTAISFDPTNVLGYTPQVGDSVYMYGTVSQFNGLIQFDLDSIDVKSTGNFLPWESFNTSLSEADENRLIRFDNVTLVNPSQWPTVGSDANVDINYNGFTYTMRIDRHTDIAQNLSAPTGRFNVIGVGGQFDATSPYTDGYQILPRFSGDIKPLYAVTFQLDMASQTVNAAGPHVAGEFRDHNGDGYPENFNNAQWVSNANPMTQDPNNPNLYTTTIYVQADSLEYKFLNGNQWGQDEQLTVGSSCTKTTGQFTNRISNITSDITLPVVCFQACNSCAAADTLYTFDFASGLPSGWTNIGDTTTALWEYRGPNTTPNVNIGSRGAFAGNNDPIQSSSASNGFMIFDSDYLDDPNGASGNGTSPAPHIGSIRTQTLNFSNETDVILQFESYYRRYQSRVGVAISTNGGTTYPDTVFVHENLPVNQATLTSEVLRLDISSFVANQSNVKLAFVFDGSLCNQFGCGYYFWMIDDIKLLRKPANDLNLFEAYYTVGNQIGRYSKMPKGISPNVTFWGNMANEGTTAQTNARVTFNGGNYNYSSTGQTLNPGASALVSSNSSFAPFQAGSYNFTATAVADNPDGHPFNNSIQIGFDVTDSTYNLSSGINNEFLGTNSWANASDTFIVANVLELTDSVELNSVGVTLSAASTPGGRIWIRVWDYNSTIRGAGGSFQNPQSPQSAMYTLTATDVSNGYVQIPIQGSGNNKKLLPGSYYVGAVLFGNSNADTVRVASDLSIFQPFDAAVIYIPKSSGFGGVYTNGNAFNLDVNVSPINPVTLPPTPTVNGDTIYKYDFNSGLPTGWVNQGDTSTSLWEYRGPNTTPNNSIGSRGAFAGNNGPIQSLTASNGFMIFDSDYLDDPNGAAGTGQSPAPHVGVLYTEALNFGNQQNVMLQLESFFRTFESGAGIAFSTDGGLTYPDTIYIHDNLIVNQVTANPETVRLDVSSYIGGQPNVKVAFIFDGRNPLGLNGGAFQRSYYFWQIDDISFQTSPSVDLAAFDIEVRNPNALGQHAAVPSFLYQNYDLDAKVTNQGAKRATNADVYCKTDAQSNTFIPDFPSSAISILNSGDTSGTLNFAPLYSSMFGNIDTYYLTFYPRSDSTDGYTFNDTIYRSFEVTNNEYRLHTNNWNGSIGTNFNVNFGTADSVELVNEFYFSNSAVINTMTIGLGSATRVGAVAIPVIYSGSLGSGLNQELLGQPYTITAADTINGFANIPVNHTVNTGAHYVGVMLNSNNTASHITIRDDLTINQHPDAALFRINGIFYSNGNALHITLNVGQPPVLAQIDLPITWDDTLNVDYTTIDFGGNTSQTIVDPNNSNNRILQSVKGAGANTWAGTILGTVNGLATNIPFTQGATSISALVFSPDSGITVRLKVEDTLNPNIFVETEVLTSKANAWDTLVFDFANQVPNTQAINFNNTYNQIVIFYDFGTSPTVAKTYYLDNVYFGGTPPPPTYNVTFQVDMRDVTQSYTTPELNGTFNGWCGNCTQMSDANNDDVWDVTIQLQAGTYEYKFAADNWAIDEILTQGSFCTVTNGGFTNRVLTVTGDTTLPAVCWASCNLCPATPPTTYNVTFQVDMNTVTQGFTTPEVNGTFNNWCGNCNAMSDANNDGVWDVTISLPADTFEFKYSADSWNIQEQLSPGLSCVVTNFGFTNRYLVITGDTTLPVVCWESCQACPPPCPAISIFATASQTVSCFGGADGGVTVTAFGGTAPYVYDWGFAQGPTISNVPANFYQVTVTDSANCVDSAWIQIHQPALPLAAETNGSMAIFEVINPNGSSFLMDFGSMAAGWGTNLETSSVFGQLVVAVDSTGDSLLCGAGIANASAINGNIAVAYRGGCEFGTKAFRAQQAGATGLVLINNGPNNVNVGAGALGSQVNIPVALINPQNGQILRNLMKQGATVYFGADTTLPMEPLCNGNMNGSIMANVQGGTSPYTFQWSNNQGARSISGLGQGNYYLTVTDAKGCTTTDTVVLNQPNPLNIGLASASNPTSNSASNGSISVNVTGGTSPYNGVWNTNPPQNGLTAANLAVGNYSVNITDANGCSDVFSYSLCVDDTSTSSITICQGDSANIFGNYETNSGFYYQTYQTLSGCDSVIEVELVVNANPVIIGVNVTQVTGCGTNDGSISLQGVGVGAITYALNTGQSQINNGVFTGLFPATYVVTVTDSNGCSNNTGPLVISPFTGSPAQPSISGNTSFQYCTGDPIQTVTATGGAGTLYWYNNASLSTPIDSGSTFTPPNVIGFNAYYVAETASGCQGPPTQIFVEINAIPNTPILSGAGTYCDIQSVNPVFAQGVGIIWYGDSALTVQVGSGAQLPIGTFANVGTTTAYATANSNGCSSPAASISVNVLPPVPSPTTSDVSYCDNESAIGLVANTTQGYSPRWYADASLTTLVSVSQNFTPSTVVGTSTFYLTQFDGTCESPAVTANSTVRQSPVVNSVFTTDVSVCGATDGAISINATIGNIGPKYSINNGQSFQTSSSFNNLAAAGYIILVADTFCSTTYGIATISAPGAPMAPSVLGNDTICDGDTYNGFSATAQGSGNLTWYNSPLLGLNNQVATGSSFTPSNLNVGVNTYYVTETQGICQGAASSVSIIVNGLPNVSAGIDQSICDGSSALLVATGATSYNWVSVGNNDSVTVSPTSQTTYTVIGTSVAGCSASDSMVVSINPLPTVTAGVVTPVCIDASNFILPKGTPNGGQYSGTNVSSNTFLVTQAGIGSHIIYYNFTDVNGCSNVDSTTVIVNGLPTVNLGSIANICANDAAIVLSTGTPANGNYSGSGVSSGSFDPAAAGGAGTYNIFYSFTDANGCSAADTNTITIDTVPVISWVAFPTICELDGPYTLVEASPTGGVYSGTGVSAGVFDISSVTVPGSYEITYGFTDANGCIGTGSQFIDAVNNPVVNLGPDTVLCNNRPSITLDAGTGATFDWLLNGVSTGQTSQTITVDSASSGTYIVIVANADGCEGSDTVVVNYESICVGIETVGEVEGKIAVYPNPTQGIFTLEISDISALRFDVEIFNTGGQIVYSQTFANTKYVREEIDLSGLSRGIYYINLKTETGVAKYKLILN